MDQNYRGKGLGHLKFTKSFMRMNSTVRAIPRTQVKVVPVSSGKKARQARKERKARRKCRKIKIEQGTIPEFYEEPIFKARDHDFF